MFFRQLCSSITCMLRCWKRILSRTVTHHPFHPRSGLAVLKSFHPRSGFTFQQPLSFSHSSYHTLLPLKPQLLSEANLNFYQREFGIRLVFSQVRFYTEDNMTENAFACDYGKRQAGCKKCKGKLEKGEMRIAKLTSNPFSEEGGPMKNYHHAQVNSTILHSSY